MSEGAEYQGRYLYALGDEETKAWFEKQWKIWPERADEKLTTNISLLYGGIISYRMDNGCDPEMSSDFRSHVNQIDKIWPTRARNTSQIGEG